MIDKCVCCERLLDTRLGFCFDCADMESLIEDRLDMYDKKTPKEIPASESMNVLRKILKTYGLIKSH